MGPGIEYPTASFASRRVPQNPGPKTPLIYVCPQGTKLGPWLFVIIINDLSILDALLWKYVDDTTVSEIISKGQSSSAQEYVDSVADWSADNRFQLNIDKCKEICISFSKNNADLPPLFINGQELEVVQNAKLLGVTITDNLS